MGLHAPAGSTRVVQTQKSAVPIQMIQRTTES